MARARGPKAERGCRFEISAIKKILPAFARRAGPVQARERSSGGEQRVAVILLDGLVPHMSHENLSESSRHAYTLHVVGGGARYPESNWLQRATPARGF